MLNPERNERYDSSQCMGKKVRSNGLGLHLTKIPCIADKKGVLFKSRKNLIVDPLSCVKLILF